MTDRSGGFARAADSDPRIEIGLATDVGQVRTGNEDSVLCEPVESALAAERGLFCAVADGMGGHAAGEDASSMAVKVARDAFYEAGDMDASEAIRLAVGAANAAVYEAGAGKTGRDHMGSTLTAVVITRGRIVVGHVGDSRCYVVKDGMIRQLTRDHSWVAEEVAAGRMTAEQARINPRRNIITRALGLRPEVEVDVYEAELEPRTIVVICSDGLHGLVDDEEILWHVRRYRPADAVDALVRLANSRGGPDNISVVVARVAGAEDEEDTKPSIPPLMEQTAPMTATAPPAYLAPSAATFDEPAPSEAVADDDRPTPRGMKAPASTAPAQVQATPAPAAPAAPPAPASPPTTPARHPATAPRRASGSRGGGVALIVVLVLLILLGAAIGVLMFRLSGLAG